MKLDAVARLVYRLGAISNWLVTLPGILFPARAAEFMGVQAPNFPFLIRIWSGMAFLWGCMFWEIAADPIGRHRLVKYSWIEKSITATSVTIAYFTHEVPLPVLLGIIATDWIWVPPFLVFDLKLKPN